jgi:capsule polysaccharide export protein KpsE/RkpR
MTDLYSNLPLTTKANLDNDSANLTIKNFNQYYNNPIDIDNNSMIYITSFFEKRGFSPDSAETIALIILSQAKRDNVNPSSIMDEIKTLDNVSISGLVGQILNYNRFNTSILGVYVTPSPADEIQRNILA